MNKIFKKSLALTVSAALCLTAFIGCLSVSAEEPVASSATITVKDATIAPGATGDVDVEFANVGDICATLSTITFPEGFVINSIKDNAEKQLFKVLDETDGGNVIINKNVLKFCEIINFAGQISTTNVILTINVTAPETAGTYTVKIGESSANYDEKFLAITTKEGTVTVASSAPVLDSSLDIPVSDLTLGIDANFYIEYYFLLDTTKYDDFKLVVSRDTYTLDSKGNYVVAKANDVEFTSASPADDVVVDAYDGESEVFCYYQGIAMYEMGLDLTAVLHVYKDGVEVAYSNPTSISFADIAKTLFSNSKGTKVKTLVTDMLILGSKAQEYFTKSGNAFDGVALPTDGFDTSLATVSYGDLDNTISGSDSFDVSLLLGQAPALVFAAEIEETLNISDLAFEISYRSDLKGEDVSLNVSADDESVYSEEDTDYGYYEVAFEKIALYDTDKVITAKFIYKPGTTDERVLLEKQISLESFIGANINSAGVKARAVYDATAKFGVSARNYFAK